MATSIPVPFVDQNFNLGNPSGAVMTFVMIVVGFAVFALGQDLGGSLANSLSQMLGVGSGAQEQQQNSVEIL